MAEIAWHLRQGDYPERGLPWTLRAGDRAVDLSAHGDAALHYRTAVELARKMGEERTEAVALDKLGHVLFGASQFEEALAALQQAGDIYKRLGEREQYLGVVALSGEVFSFGGRAAEGVKRVLPVVRAFEEEGVRTAPSPRLADLYAALCSLYYQSRCPREAVETAEVAVSVAESTRNLRALSTAEVWRGLSLGMLGRLPEQRRAFQRSFEVAEQLGDPGLLSIAVYHHSISFVATGRLDEGELYMRRALEIIEHAGQVGWSSFARAGLSELLSARGRWEEARIEAERAEEDSRSAGPRQPGIFPLVALGRILLLQGAREDGLRQLHEALTLAGQYDFHPGITLVQQVLAWEEVREDRPKDALALLESVPSAEGIADRPWYPPIHAWAQVEAGNEGRARDLLCDAREKAIASGERVRLPALLRLSAKLAVRQSRWEDAALEIAEGLLAAREIGLTYEEAQLLEDEGYLQAAWGNMDLARGRFEEALAVYRRLGAAPDIDRVERVIAARETA